MWAGNLVDILRFLVPQLRSFSGFEAGLTGAGRVLHQGWALGVPADFPQQLPPVDGLGTAYGG